MTVSITKPSMSVLTPIPGGFLQGKMIRIRGVVNSSPIRFDVNLQNQRGDQRTLHLNPRFREQVVVRNSVANGKWGEEVRHGPSFPLKPDQEFDILLVADSDHYKIVINGKHFAEFYYRDVPERATHLEMHGDATIASVTFEDPTNPATKEMTQPTNWLQYVFCAIIAFIVIIFIRII